MSVLASRGARRERRRPLLWRWLVVAALSGGVGCDGCEPAAPTPAPSTSAQPPDAALEGPSIELTLDGNSRTLVVPRQLTLLANVVAEPSSRWQLLEAETHDGRRLSLERFASRYLEHDVRLSVDDEGRVHLGVYRRARPDMPAYLQQALKEPRHALVGVARVRVLTVMPEPPPPRSWLVRVGEDDKRLTEADLQGLAARRSDAAEPGRGRRQSGWPLRDVVALFRPLEEVASVTLVDREGETHTFDHKALLDPAKVPTVRIHRAGELGVSVVEADQAQPSARIRDVVEIRLHLARAP